MRQTGFGPKPKQYLSSTSASSSSSSSSDSSVKVRQWKIFEFLYDNRLPMYQLIAILLATAISLTIRSLSEGPITARQTYILKVPGTMFTRILQCISLPLMCTGVVTAMSKLHLWRLGYIGMRIYGYVILTTVIAATIASLMMIILQPGTYVDLHDNSTAILEDKVVVQDFIIDMVRNAFPDNIIQAVILTGHLKSIVYKTQPTDTQDLKNRITRECRAIRKENFANVRKEFENGLYHCLANDGELKDVEDWKIDTVLEERTNVTGVLCFFTYLGVCLGSLDPSFYLIHDLFDSITEAGANCIRFIMWFSPAAFFCIVLTELLSIESYEPMKVKWNFVVSSAGIMFFHMVVIVPIVFFIGVRKQAYSIYFSSAEVIMTTLVTSSSYTSFPVAFYCANEKLHIPKVISLYFLPIAALMNMDGASMYVSLATMYLAQGLQLPFLDPTKFVLTILASTLLSFMVPGIPNGFMSPIMNIPFVIYDIPSEYTLKMEDVDWLIDRLCTIVNVLMDLVGVVMVHHLSAHLLEEEQDELL